MALVTMVAGNTARASHVNSNFALCVLTDTSRTITVTHTYTASQTFTGGWTSAAAVTVTAGRATLGGGAAFSGTDPSALYTGGVGAPSATAPIHVLRPAGAPQLFLARVNTSYAAPSVVASGDTVGALVFGGYDSTTTLAIGASLQAVASETWSSTVRGTGLTFTVRANGGTVATTALTLGNDATATFASTVITAASTTARAGIRIPSGVAPSAPTSGDLWYNGTNLIFRDGSTDRTITWV